MKDSLIYFILMLLAIPVFAAPAQASQGSAITSQVAFNLNALPLVTRSLAEFRSEASAVDEAATAKEVHGAYIYRHKSENAEWLMTSLLEPFYLSLLGAGLLLLGTVRWRDG